MINENLVRQEICALLPQIGETALAGHIISSVLDEAKDWNRRTVRHGESLAFAVNNVKTAALCYDRLWVPSSEQLGIPEEITFTDGGRASLRWTLAHLLEEEWLQANFPVGSGYGRFGSEGKLLGNDPDRKMIDQICLKGFGTVLTDEDHGNVRMPTPLRNVIRNYSHLLYETEQMQVIPVYPSNDDWDRDFTPRSQVRRDRTIGIVMATLNDLEIVEESALTWEQVLEFRRDPAASRKYRRLLHWLEAEMRNESKQFVIDEIGKRLEDYRWALNKHGIKSVLGVASEALSGAYLTGVTTFSSVVTTATANPLLGMLAGGGLVVGRVAVSLAEKYIDRKDITNSRFREIAWIHDIGK